MSAGCPGLPLCDERSSLGTAWLHGLHRVAGLLLLAGLVWAAVLMRKRRGSMLATAFNHSAALFMVLQGLVGVSLVSQTLPVGLRVLHLGIATLIWLAVVAEWVLALRARNG